MTIALNLAKAFAAIAVFDAVVLALHVANINARTKP